MLARWKSSLRVLLCSEFTLSSLCTLGPRAVRSSHDGKSCVGRFLLENAFVRSLDGKVRFAPCLLRKSFVRVDCSKAEVQYGFPQILIFYIARFAYWVCALRALILAELVGTHEKKCQQPISDLNKIPKISNLK